MSPYYCKPLRYIPELIAANCPHCKRRTIGTLKARKVTCGHEDCERRFKFKADMEREMVTSKDVHFATDVQMAHLRDLGCDGEWR